AESCGETVRHQTHDMAPIMIPQHPTHCRPGTWPLPADINHTHTHKSGLTHTHTHTRTHTHTQIQTHKHKHTQTNPLCTHAASCLLFPWCGVRVLLCQTHTRRTLCC